MRERERERERTGGAYSWRRLYAIDEVIGYSPLTQPMLCQQ